MTTFEDIITNCSLEGLVIFIVVLFIVVFLLYGCYHVFKLYIFYIQKRKKSLYTKRLPIVLYEDDCFVSSESEKIVSTKLSKYLRMVKKESYMRESNNGYYIVVKVLNDKNIIGKNLVYDKEIKYLFFKFDKVNIIDDIPKDTLFFKPYAIVSYNTFKEPISIEVHIAEDHNIKRTEFEEVRM